MDLICARIQSDSGFLGSARNTIYRLRKGLDVIAGAGKKLIETGRGEEYRLTIPCSELRARVGVARCFYDLVVRKFVAEEQADILRKHCRPCNLRDIDPSPSAD